MPTSPPCPKCSSRSTNIVVARSLYIGQPPDQIFSCYTCGKRVYGVEAVTALVNAEQAKVQEAQRAAEAAKAAAAAAAAEAKCAWPPCPNDHTPTSKYCSRTCNDRNAHARAKARKLPPPPSWAQVGVHPEFSPPGPNSTR